MNDSDRIPIDLPPLAIWYVLYYSCQESSAGFCWSVRVAQGNHLHLLFACVGRTCRCKKKRTGTTMCITSFHGNGTPVLIYNVSAIPLDSEQLWEHLWACRVLALPRPSKVQLGPLPFCLASNLVTAFALFLLQPHQSSYQALASYFLSRNLSLLVAQEEVCLPFQSGADLPSERLSLFCCWLLLTL